METEQIETLLTENGIRVLEARYLKKDSSGNVLETPEDLFTRVADAVAMAEKNYSSDTAVVENYKKNFFSLMASGRFMPNSPTLMNAGREMGMLSACFVLPLEDSIDGIFSTIKATAQIQKAGGGTGFSFDRLRPTGDYIKTSGGQTSGPISFWKVLSEATNAIQQGAFRRGANMGMMSITHPDILKFVTAKQSLDRFTNFNISVKISDDWMDDYNQCANAPHVVTNPRSGISYVMPKDIDMETSELMDLIELDNYESLPLQERPVVWTCEEMYNLIIECAWRTGEPGLIFPDEINRKNPTPNVGEIEATNPCGEQPLLPYEACNLGSINISVFIISGHKGEPVVAWDNLRESIHDATRFLDNIIDINLYPITEIAEMSRNNRKIGLGIMGFADALYKMGIAYNSEDALIFGEKIMKFINDESHNASEALALDRGSFANWEGSVWDTRDNRPMRNAATTTVAPTGTISIIANCSGGIEPLFALAFTRNVLNGQKMIEVNDIFKAIADQTGVYSKELMEKVALYGSISNIDDLPDNLKKVFVVAHDIDAKWHVKMQAAFQIHCDSSISKTINLSAKATPDDVKNIYNMAWKLNCKGITVYRDGCRMEQPMSLEDKTKKNDKEVEKSTKAKYVHPVHTPSILSAVRIRQNTPFGHMHVNITVDPKQDCELEVFAQLGKAGDVAMSDLEAISRLISLFLRIGGSLEQVINQLEGIGSHLSIPTKDGRVMSLADGLGKTLRRYQEAKRLYGIRAILTGEVDFNKMASLTEVAKANKATSTAKINKTDTMLDMFKIKCPECNSGTLNFTEGCVKCISCGYSQC